MYIAFCNLNSETIVFWVFSEFNEVVCTPDLATMTSVPPTGQET